LDDGILEVTVFNSVLSFATFSPSRVAQEKGPLQIEFAREEGKKLVTYLNVDGEFTQITNPKKLTIKIADCFTDGKLTLLLKNKKKPSKNSVSGGESEAVVEAVVEATEVTKH
jgi:hypothetical protein